MWTLNPDIFLATDVIKSSPVLYREYLRRSQQKKMPVQKISGCVWGKFDLNLDTCGRGNFCIRKEKVADLKISGYDVPRRDQRASVKLIFKITFKFRTSSFLYPTVLPGKIHVVTRIIDTGRQKSFKTIYALPFSMVNQLEAESHEHSRSTS